MDGETSSKNPSLNSSGVKANFSAYLNRSDVARNSSRTYDEKKLFDHSSLSPSTSSSHDSQTTVIEGIQPDQSTHFSDGGLNSHKCQTQGNINSRRGSKDILMDERDSLLLGHIGDVISYYQCHLRSGIISTDNHLEKEKVNDILDNDNENKTSKDLYQYSNGKNTSHRGDESYLMTDSLSSSSGSGSSSSSSSPAECTYQIDQINQVTNNHFSQSDESEALIKDDLFQSKNKISLSDNIPVSGNALEGLVKESQLLDEQPPKLEEVNVRVPNLRARALWHKARPPSLTLKLQQRELRENKPAEIEISPTQNKGVPLISINQNKMSGFRAMMAELREAQQEGANQI